MREFQHRESPEQRHPGALDLGYHEGLTATSISATDEALNNPTPPTQYTGRAKKYNACKGKLTPVPTHYALEYYDVDVDNWYYGQPAADLDNCCPQSSQSSRNSI